MVTVRVNQNESIDQTLKKFESKVRKAQIYKILRQKSYYISKSEQRHRKRSKRGR